jgi:hypothetical protein
VGSMAYTSGLTPSPARMRKSQRSGRHEHIQGKSGNKYVIRHEDPSCNPGLQASSFKAGGGHILPILKGKPSELNRQNLLI